MPGEGESAAAVWWQEMQRYMGKAAWELDQVANCTRQGKTKIISLNGDEIIFKRLGRSNAFNIILAVALDEINFHVSRKGWGPWRAAVESSLLVLLHNKRRGLSTLALAVTFLGNGFLLGQGVSVFADK